LIQISGPPLLAAALLLAPAGCGEPEAAVAAAYSSRVVDGSFDIGTPDRYASPRVYRQFSRSHGVYLVSDHGMLVALAAECTNPDHRPSLVRFDDGAGIFRCGTCGARYTRDGLKIGTSQTQRSLGRCRIRPSGQIYDPQTTILIDPGKRFYQEDQEWSKQTSYYPLGEAAARR
jgi:hypothetical protein